MPVPGTKIQTTLAYGTKICSPTTPEPIHETTRPNLAKLSMNRRLSLLTPKVLELPRETIRSPELVTNITSTSIVITIKREPL